MFGGGRGLRCLLEECGGFAGGEEVGDIVEAKRKRGNTVRREILGLFLLRHDHYLLEVNTIKIYLKGSGLTLVTDTPSGPNRDLRNTHSIKINETFERSSGATNYVKS